MKNTKICRCGLGKKKKWNWDNCVISKAIINVFRVMSLNGSTVN